MNRTTFIFFTTTLLLGICAVYLWQQLLDEREEVSRLHARIALDATQHKQGQRNGLTAEAFSQQEHRIVVEVPVVTDSVASNTGNSAAIRLPIGGASASEVSEAAFRAMRQQYPDLERMLGLSKMDAEALYGLLRRQANPSEIEALLGPMRYRSWQEYEPTIGVRRKVASWFASSAETLRGDQIESLVALMLAEERRRKEDERTRSFPTTDPLQLRRFEEENFRAAEQSYRRIVDLSQQYLSQHQLAVMQNVVTRQLGSQRAALERKRAVLEGRSN